MIRNAFVLTAILLVGCGDATKPTMTGSDSKAVSSSATLGPAGTPAETGASAAKPADQAAPLEPGTADLNASNTRIEFVGTHSGDKPDPRVGGFEKFTGKVSIAESKELTAVSFNIDADSIWTQFDKLTAHLKSPDFFEVKEFPTIKFESTKVEAVDAAAGSYTVAGDLTLHGVTKPISVPVVINSADKKLTAEFSIDRAEFGMTFGEGKVDNNVALTVVIGEKTEPKEKIEIPAQ